MRNCGNDSSLLSPSSLPLLPSRVSSRLGPVRDGSSTILACTHAENRLGKPSSVRERSERRMIGMVRVSGKIPGLEGTTLLG